VSWKAGGQVVEERSGAAVSLSFAKGMGGSTETWTLIPMDEFAGIIEKM